VLSTLYPKWFGFGYKMFTALSVVATAAPAHVPSSAAAAAAGASMLTS
jgi:hypothetical protein